jgi:hypothetical protein
MPDLDAIDDLARLPAPAPGRPATAFSPAQPAAVSARSAPPGGVAVNPFAGVILRHLDVVAVLLATIPALIGGVPAFGYAIGAGAWLAQRFLAHFDRNWIRRAREPHTQFGLNLVEAFGRIWLLAGAIVLAAVIGGRRDGLTASLLIFGAYSIAFAVRLVSGRPQGGPQR